MRKPGGAVPKEKERERASVLLSWLQTPQVSCSLAADQRRSSLCRRSKVQRLPEKDLKKPYAMREVFGKTFLVLLKLRTRINWLLPRSCLNCQTEFNRFDQGGVCDRCQKLAKAAHQIKRSAAIRGATRYDTGISHWAVHQVFNGVCGICNHKTQPPEIWDIWDGKSWMPFAPTVDHIIPVSRAGTHTWDNVQLAHALCNSLKSAR